MMRIAVLITLLTTTSALAQTSLLKEIVRTVSVAIITDAAKASVNSFIETKPQAPNQFQRAKFKELLERTWLRSLPDQEKADLFASSVDWFEDGVVAREHILQYRRRQFRADPVRTTRIDSIDEIEVDPKGKFAAVSYTISTRYTGKDGKPKDVQSRQVALIGGISSTLRIHALKNRA